MKKYSKRNNKLGFTLIETLISIAIIVIVFGGIYSGFVGIQKILTFIRVKGIMTNLANEQFEVVRNLPYQNIGTVSGIPAGIIPQVQTVNRDGKDFSVETTIRSVDEPFDGIFNGTPKDLSPADMKIIELNISCVSCNKSVSPISFTTKVSPKNLETASTNGALVVRVFDSSGLPVSGANVNIINNNIKTEINKIDIFWPQFRELYIIVGVLLDFALITLFVSTIFPLLINEFSFVLSV
jgi:prepilin-type N-terminal cleavage/methylation domain-containing protein